MRVSVKDAAFVGTNSVWGDAYNLIIKEKCGAIVTKKCGIKSSNAIQTLIFLTKNNVEYQVVIEEPNATGSHTMNIALSDLPPPPANDEKTGSIAMTVSPNLSLTNWLKGDVSTATISSTNISNYQNGNNREIWYNFKATAKVHQLFIQNFNVKSLGTLPSYMYGYYVLVDATQNLAIGSGSIYWIDGQLSGDVVSVFKNLTIGKNYYLLFYSSSDEIGEGYTFEMAMRTPPIPSNDECAKAKVLPMNTNWSCDNSVAGSTAWSLGENNSRDIWYAFIATQPQHRVMLNNVVATDPSNPINYEVKYFTECGISGFEVFGSKTGMLTGLTVGKKYFIQILTYSAWGNDVLFDICVTTPTSVVANASCATAFPVPVNADDSPTKRVSGVTSFPNAQFWWNDGGADDAVWYKFTATSEWHQLRILDFQGITGNNTVYPSLKIYKSENCDNSWSVDVASTPYLIGCEIGKEYLVQLYTSDTDTRAKFTIAITTVPRPLNDWCTDAVSLKINPDSLVVSSSPVRLNLATYSKTMNYNESDVWYKFVATEKNVQLKLKPTTPPVSNWFLPEMELWEGGNCDKLIKRWNNTKDWSFDPFVMQPLPTLKKGVTYYIRIHEFNNGGAIYKCTNCNYQISIHQGEPSSSFDECETPISCAVNSNQTCTTKTAFKIKNPSLTSDSIRQANDAILLQGMTIQNDIWATFVAKNETHFVEIDGILGEKLGISTDSCATSTLRYEPLQLGNNSKSNAFLYHLTVGTRYYLRMLNVGDSLSVCITTPPPPPANDAWQNAEPLTIQLIEDNCKQSATFTTQWATPDVLPFNWQCHPRSADVWYKFKATSTQHWIKFDTLMVGFEYFIYKKNPTTQELENIICDQYVHGPNGNGYLLKGFTPDSTYYLSIAPAFATRYDVAHQFNFCVSVDTSYYFQTPVNDWCQNATTIVPVPFGECSNGVYQLGEATPWYGTFTYEDKLKRDVWFKFEAKHSKYLLTVHGDKNTNLYFPTEVQAGNCPDGLHVIYNYKQNDALTNLTIGQTYYIRVFQRDELNTFKICLQIPPPSPSNDAPCAAKSIAVNASNFPVLYEDGNTVSATPSNTPQTCPNYPFLTQEDVWYKFNATSKQHWVRLYNTEAIASAAYPTYSNLTFSLFEGTCSNLTPFSSAKDCFEHTAYVENLTIGKEYFVKITNDHSNSHAFRLAILSNSNATNFTCATPKFITLANGGTSGVLQGNTAVPISGSVDPWINLNIHNSTFQFKAPSKQGFIRMLDLSKWNNEGMFYHPLHIIVYKGNCNDPLKYINIQYDANPNPNPNYVPYMNWEENETYTICFYTNTTEGFHNFSFELVSIQNPVLPAPSTCATAKNLTVNPDQALVQTLTNTFKNNDAESVTHWYSFTATHQTQIIQINDPDNYISHNYTYRPFMASNALYTVCGGTIAKKLINASDYAWVATNLTIGQTYFFAFEKEYPFSEMIYQIGITSLEDGPKPPHDDCVNAIPLIVGNPCINPASYHIKNANPDPSYNYTEGVWHSFKATSANIFLTISDFKGIVPDISAGFPLAVTLFKGDNCSSKDPIQGYNLYPNPTSCQEYITDLEVNANYFLYVHSHNLIGTEYNYSICLSEANTPANDVCVNAITVPVSPTLTALPVTTGTTYSSTSPDIPNWSGDVWYKFTATAKLHQVNIKNKNNYSYLSPTILPVLYQDCDTIFDTGSGNNCYLNAIDTTEGFLHYEYRNLTIGKEYFIQLFSNYGDEFELCVTTPPYIPNSSCEEAFAVPVSDTSFCDTYSSQNIKSVKTSVVPSLNGYGKVAWFKFQAKTARHRVEIRNLKQDADLKTKLAYTIFENCTTTLDSFIFVQNEWYSTTPDSILRNLKIGATYYVKVEMIKQNSWQQDVDLGDFKFDIAVSTFPSNTFNDDPDYAVTIPVNGSWSCQNTVHGSTVDATPTRSPNELCSGGDDDVWYKFVAKKSQHFISIKNVKPEVGDVIDMNYEVYRAKNDGTFENNSLGCQESRQYALGAWDFEEGRTYYLRIFTQYVNGYSRCSFDVCITTPIVQDAPKGAVQTTLLAAKGEGACQQTATSTSEGATYSYEAGVLTGTCEQILLPKDIWFKTEITTKKPKLAFKFNQFPTGAVPQVAAYRLKNGVLQAFSTNTCPFDTLNGLKQNDLIYFRVWDGLGKSFGTYEICVTEAGTITSIEEEEATENNAPTPAEIQLYPNPATDDLTVALQYLHHDHITVRISNLAGQMLYQQQYVNNENGALTLHLPINELPASSYILVITDGAQRYYKKFVKM